MTMLRPPENGSYIVEILVDPSDIDDQNHVNNVVYLRWVQEVAAAHWDHVASLELQGRCNWVVLRHEIDYHSPALPGDKVRATTWVDPPKGPLQHRFVTLDRKEDGKRLASATTTWCLLDVNTGKPRRISSEIVSVFSSKN
jgi:acyl-CoA thioester hydrolase